MMVVVMAAMAVMAAIPVMATELDPSRLPGAFCRPFSFPSKLIDSGLLP
jgi:hypothetical protein